MHPAAVTHTRVKFAHQCQVTWIDGEVMAKERFPALMAALSA